jgi:hypothetical protein
MSLLDIETVNIDEEFDLALTRVLYVLRNAKAYICINRKCGNVFEMEGVQNAIECYFCKTSWCCNCLTSPHHKDKTCLQHEILSKDNENSQLIAKMQNEGLLKFCPTPGCGAPIIKSGGCNKMTCEQCSAHWCWLCKEIGIDYSHFNINSTGMCAGELWERKDNNEIAVLPDNRFEPPPENYFNRFVGARNFAPHWDVPELFFNGR